MMKWAKKKNETEFSIAKIGKRFKKDGVYFTDKMVIWREKRI